MTSDAFLTALAFAVALWLVTRVLLSPLEAAIASILDNFWRALPTRIVDKWVRGLVGGLIEDHVIESMVEAVSRDPRSNSWRRGWVMRMSDALGLFLWALGRAWFDPRSSSDLRLLRWLVPSGCGAFSVLMVVVMTRSITNAGPVAALDTLPSFLVCGGCVFLVARQSAHLAGALALVGEALVFVSGGVEGLTLYRSLLGVSVNVIFVAVGVVGLLGAVLGRGMRWPIGDRMVLPMLYTMVALAPIMWISMVLSVPHTAPLWVLVGGVIAGVFTAPLAVIHIVIARLLLSGAPVVPGAALR